MSNLSEIQSKVKAPKGQLNKFGNYRYRSAEDIVEAVKPIINPMGFALVLTDEMTEVGGRVYVRSTARIFNSEGESYAATGWAREEEVKKGMDGSQITGAASSYARKYALNGLFAIDDTKDSDATNTHDDTPDEAEKKMLVNLVYNSDLNEEERAAAFEAIKNCTDYTKYQAIQHKLEMRQKPYDEETVASYKQAKTAVRKAVANGSK